MELRALLLSGDEASVEALRVLMADVGIVADLCARPQDAKDTLAQQKYDAVIVDCDDLVGGVDFLRQLRHLPSNQRSIVFAMVNGKTRTYDAFDMGANFVLEKPISSESAMRHLRAARGLMIHERRRYYRHPVNMVVYLEIAQSNRYTVYMATDLSAGGMALTNNTDLAAGMKVNLRFDLPTTEDEIEARGEVAWTDTQGRCGIKFVQVPVRYRAKLDAWLAERKAEQQVPVFVVHDATA
jgi:DNA-binding response OmpR family regulator